MRRLILLLAAIYLPSCATTHVSESPLRDAKGTPVVIRIPKVPQGHLPRPVDVMALDAKLYGESGRDQMLEGYLPELKGSGRAVAKLDGMTGEVKTFRGEIFHAYFPILKVEAAASQERVDAATKSVAADLYTRARKTSQVYPMTDLAIRH